MGGYTKICLFLQQILCLDWHSSYYIEYYRWINYYLLPVIASDIRNSMSNRGSRDEASDVGEQPPAATVPSSSAAEASASGTEAAKIGISSLTLADNAKAPQTPTTPSTLEAKTTGTDSEHSSVHGADEGGTKSPEPEEKARKVIAVSVSKGPSAFFNLARKFLVTDEECDLSALEGAIVSAVDAAHLLERSKIATIIKYVYLVYLLCCMYTICL